MCDEGFSIFVSFHVYLCFSLHQAMPNLWDSMLCLASTSRERTKYPVFFVKSEGSNLHRDEILSFASLFKSDLALNLLWASSLLEYICLPLRTRKCLGTPTRSLQDAKVPRCTSRESWTNKSAALTIPSSEPFLSSLPEQSKARNPQVENLSDHGCT